MRTIKDGGQIETKHFLAGTINSYRSLYDLMKDEREYKKVRSELNLPFVRIDESNDIVYVKTFRLESWSGTVTRNYYFVFDQRGRLVPNFLEDEVPVGKNYSILCLVYDPPYNMDNVNIEFCSKLDKLYIEPLSRDRRTPLYKLRDSADFYPGRGIPSTFELSEMIKNKVQLSDSHEFDTLHDLRRSTFY